MRIAKLGFTCILMLVGSTQVHAKCAEHLQPLLEGETAPYRGIVCEEFRGHELNTDLWSYNYTWGSGEIIGTTRVHNFAATMDEKQVKVRNGRLTIRAKDEVHPSALITRADGSQEIAQMPWKFCQQLKQGDRSQCELRYTTGAITSRFKFQYGYIEARMRLPATPGFWPAFWMLHDGWPPEIDILEVLTNFNDADEPDYFFSQNYHYNDNGYRSAYKAFNRDDMIRLGLCMEAEPQCGKRFARWQVYGMKWAPGEISFYINGRYSHGIRNARAVTSIPGYIILNLGVGGWAANPDSRTDWDKAKMEVDWLRVWELPAAAAVP